MLTTILVSLAVSVFFFLVGWLLALAARKAVMVDGFWGAVGAILALTAFLMTDGSPARRWLLLILVLAWGLRLTIYLSMRMARSGEDPRYAEMHKKSGQPFWLFTLTTVFGLQSIILWFNLLPVTVAATQLLPYNLTLLDYAGAAIWLIGFFFQAVGDFQLASFKAKPENKGKVLSSGLWRYTRHPNYFGETLMWWGIYLIAAATDAGRWMILSPLLMTFLLLRVSGVAMTDRFMSKKGEDFERYRKRTSAFFPWPPKADEEQS